VVAIIGAASGLISLGWHFVHQHHRARLDKLDRLHARRVEKVEGLYEAVVSSARFVIPEEMTGPPPEQFSEHVQPEFGRRAAIDNRYAAAKIYLSDASDRLLKELFEHLDQIALACALHEELWQAETWNDQVRSEFDKFRTSRDSARSLVEQLRIALRQDIEHPRQPA